MSVNSLSDVKRLTVTAVVAVFFVAVACGGSEAVDRSESLPQRWFSAAESQDYALVLRLVHPLQSGRMTVAQLRTCFGGNAIRGTRPRATFISQEEVESEIPGVGERRALTRIHFELVFTVRGERTAPEESSLLAERYDGEWRVVIEAPEVVAACSDPSRTPRSAGIESATLSP